jgi:hypothetical protein
MTETKEAGKEPAENVKTPVESKPATKGKTTVKPKVEDGKSPETTDNPQAKTTETKAVKVRVIGEGRLGHLLLKKGDVTGDERYVKLLETERGRRLVEEVK